MSLPRILAGPALRRTDRQEVWIWLCTSEALTLSAAVYVVDDTQQLGERIGSTDRSASRSFSLSATLHVHLVRVVPDAERFDHTTVLGYQLFEGEGDEATPLEGYEESDFGVGPYAFPTFSIQYPDANALRALFASCRKFHGGGDDASVGMLAHLAANLTSGASGRPRMRPTATFLLGDQIYADDVAGLIFPSVIRIAGELSLQAIPGYPAIALEGIGERQYSMYRDAGFTSNEAENHLNTLGEYAAMYLLAWNDLVWDPTELGSDPPTVDFTDRAAVEVIEQRHSLREAMRGSAAMRVLLANVPTYMMFDDHDVTDDWNINPSWVRHVRTKPLGKFIITNALVAYWAFQGWGNDPEAFDDDFLQQVTDFLAATGTGDRDEEIRDDSFEFFNCNQRAHYWSFTAPTSPGAVFLDFRTHRSAARDTSMLDYWLDLRDPITYQLITHTPSVIGDTVMLRSPHGVARMRETRLNPQLGSTRLNGAPARLINSALLRRARRLVASFVNKPMILVTGTPVIGASIVDFGQEVAIYAQGSFTWDFENWRGDPENLLDLYELIRYSEASTCIVLSGDVHYTSAFIGEIEWPNSRGPSRMNVAQFTSSAAKNTGFPPAELMRFAQDLFNTGGDLASRWLGAAPSGADGESTSVGRLLFATTDEMRAFAPVFSVTGVPASPLLPDFVYCDESWRMQSLGGLGMYMSSNFGWLVASDDSSQIVSVQMRDAANNVLGDTMRVASTLRT